MLPFISVVMGWTLARIALELPDMNLVHPADRGLVYRKYRDYVHRCLKEGFMAGIGAIAGFVILKALGI